MIWKEKIKDIWFDLFFFKINWNFVKIYVLYIYRGKDLIKYVFIYIEVNYGICIIFLFGWNDLINVLVNVFCRMREKEM